MKNYITDVELVHEGLICKTLLDIYEQESLVLELAGALPLACVLILILFLLARKYKR